MALSLVNLNTSSAFYFGLVRLDALNNSRKIPGGRFASNGLYLNGLSADQGGYDATLKGADYPEINRELCKTGISTGLTCGKVIYEYHRDGIGGPVVAVVDVIPGEGTNAGGYLLAKGDSGGALYNPANNYLLGITSEVVPTGTYNGKRQTNVAISRHLWMLLKNTIFIYIPLIQD